MRRALNLAIFAALAAVATLGHAADQLPPDLTARPLPMAQVQNVVDFPPVPQRVAGVPPPKRTP